MRSKTLFIGDPLTYDYIFDGHAGAGPSGAERWMNCTASLQASREFLETLTPAQAAEFARAGGAARQGTTAHAAAETEALLALGRIDQAEADATLLELAVMPDAADEAYDAEMGETITEYVDLIRQYAADRGPEAIGIEDRLYATIALTGKYEGWEHTIAGSGDCTVEPTKEEPDLVVADLKYGSGHDVTVESNPQIRIYGLGALAAWMAKGNKAPERLTYHIVQPRLGGIKTWSEPVSDLLAWRDEVLAPALTAALYGTEAGAEFNPSDTACMWCPARGTCTALAESRVEQAALLFDIMGEHEYEHGPGTFPSGSSLSDERLGVLLSQVLGLSDILDDLKGEAQRRLLRGTEVPGFKLVSYTPPRRWKADAANNISDDLPVWKPSTLVTPTAALKALKKDDEALKAIEDFIDAPPKRPVVAPEHDRRKSWEGVEADEMFEIEEGTA